MWKMACEQRGVANELGAPTDGAAVVQCKIANERSREGETSPVRGKSF